MSFAIGRLTRLTLGFEGESNARPIEIDMTDWLEDWPGAAVGLLLMRPGEENFYPVVTTMKAGVMRYVPTRADVEIPGEGLAQIVLTDANDVELRSRVVKTVVEASLPGSVADAPDEPMQPFVDQVLDAAARAEQAAKDAEEHKLDGFSPTVTVSKSGKVTTVKITDVNGTKTATINDGADGAPGTPGRDGQDGYTPVKGRDYFDGKDGQDGYTPVKGRDYFDGTDGAPGQDGAAATVRIGTVTTLEPGSNATVSNSGTSTDAILNFGIPRGADGEGGSGGGGGTVTSVNGVEPDKDGNVELDIPDISGKLDADKLPEAIEEALAQAKASGEFDGEDGAPGAPGQDGNGIKSVVLNADYTLTLNLDDGTTYTTPSIRGAPGAEGQAGDDGVGISSIKQTTTSSADGGTNVVTVTKTDGTTSTFSVKNGSKGSPGDAGSPGAAGKDGADGVSPTVSVSKSGKVTTVTITDKAGTKTATINDGADGAPGAAGSPGSKGDPGDPGEPGQRGTGILNTTTGIATYTTAVGGVTPAYRILLSTLKTQSKVSDVLVGDMVRYSYYVYPVVYVDAEYAYLGTRVSIRGSTGAAGTTPVKGTDYFTAADKAEMVTQVKAALPTLTMVGTDASGVEHTWTIYGS